jgi:hypothetical protein
VLARTLHPVGALAVTALVVTADAAPVTSPVTTVPRAPATGGRVYLVVEAAPSGARPLVAVLAPDRVAERSDRGTRARRGLACAGSSKRGRRAETRDRPRRDRAEQSCGTAAHDRSPVYLAGDRLPGARDDAHCTASSRCPWPGASGSVSGTTSSSSPAAASRSRTISGSLQSPFDNTVPSLPTTKAKGVTRTR